jgi:GntR family transcriptional regulator
MMTTTPALNASVPEPSHLPSVGLTLESGFVPYYEQIAEQIRQRVRANDLVPGQSYYSEGEVARALGISKMPVRQAFQKLRSEGLLVIARGKRPVIGTGRVQWDFQELRGFSEEMRRRGLAPSARVLSNDIVDATPSEVTQELRLDPGAKVYRLRRLRYINAEPVAVVTSYLPASIFQGLEQEDLEKQSLYHVIEHVYKRKLHWAEEAIGAITAGDEEALILQTEVGAALLHVKETTFDILKTPIEYSVSFLRADRYTASVISFRKK